MKREQKRILLVEDDLVTSRMVSTYLDHYGYQVVHTKRGSEVPALLNQDGFNLVLLDISLPDMSGWDLLGHLRSQYSEATLPIIMMTSMDKSRDMVRAFDLGANDFLTKPIDFPVAMARIRTQLVLQKMALGNQEMAERYDLLTRGSIDGIWDWNLESNEIFSSQRCLAMLGYKSFEKVAHPNDFLEKVHPEDRRPLKKRLGDHFAGRTPIFEAGFRLLTGNGHYRWLVSRALAVRGENGRAIRLAGTLTDNTARKTTDPLTGQPNQVYFMDHLAQALKKGTHSDEGGFALLVVDLDGFQVVKNALGHHAADMLLTSCCARLTGCMRDGDTLARIGEDTFAILVEKIRNAIEVENLAAHILEAMEEPFHLLEKECFATLSIGIVCKTRDDQNPEEALKHATNAMNAAKRLGGAQFQVFDPVTHGKLQKEILLETELRYALQRDELRLLYQPQIDLKSGKIRGVEALIRWLHPEKGEIQPVEFIPLAEKTSLILEIGEWVLWTACKQGRQWQREGLDLMVSVNLCGGQLRRKHFAQLVTEVLESTEFPPQKLALEFTESMLIDHNKFDLRTLHQLKEIGCLLAIDDFGTGHSSLSYLKRLPVDIIKIDRGFIKDISRQETDREITGAIINLGHVLGRKVIAEGVEHIEQVSILKSLSCDLAQGFHFCMPVTAAELSSSRADYQQLAGLPLAK